MPHKGMSSHHSASSLKEEWLTPPYIINSLGTFDLDPCAPINRPWETATNHFTIKDNGLTLPWTGRVWLNPPYNSSTNLWLNKLTSHNNGIALIFARTETKSFFDHVWNKADAILFIKGRLFFHHVDGSPANANAGAPSCLVAYGPNNLLSLQNSDIKGKLIILHKTNPYV